MYNVIVYRYSPGKLISNDILTFIYRYTNVNIFECSIVNIILLDN